MDNYQSILTLDGIDKKETDYSSVADEQIPLAMRLSKFRDRFDEAMELLYQLEKLTRSGSDMASCTRVLLAMVDICIERQKWEKLNECVLVVAKRRNAMKQAITKMIQKCMSHIGQCPTKEIKLELIETLRTVSEGKIYVEVERARLTKLLADIKESEGDINGAAVLMGELKVETYGTMERREKTQLVLEQMRLFTLKQDYDLAQILSKKISSKFLEDLDQNDLKIKFYNLKIILDRESSFLETSRHYQALYNCNSLSEKEKVKIMINAVLYCVLAPYNNEQQDMMQNLLKNEFLTGCPLMKTLLEIFTCKEIIIPDLFYKEFGDGLSKLEVFSEKSSHGRNCWNELKERLVEHNILIISTYYTRIYLSRLSELIRIPAAKCEEHISKMVNAGTISVKIDRPLGIVNFTTKMQATDVLNEWSSDISELMRLVNKTCHLISKELCTESIEN